MTPRRIGLGVVVLAVAGVAGWSAWRTNGQIIELVVVNESSRALSVSWGASANDPGGTETLPPCSSASYDRASGQDWHVAMDGNVVARRTDVSLAPLASRVAYVVHVTTGGTVTAGPAYETRAPIGAPFPSGCETFP